MKRFGGILSIAWVTTFGIASPCIAQSEPPAQSLCDMPNERGTAAYEEYCGTNISRSTNENGAAQTARAAAAQRKRNVELESERSRVDNEKRQQELARRTKFIADRDKAVSALRGPESNISVDGSQTRDTAIRGITPSYGGLRTATVQQGFLSAPTKHYVLRLEDADNLSIKKEIEGTQKSLQSINAALALDDSERQNWEEQSERATDEAFTLAGSAILDLVGAHVDNQVQFADAELKRSTVLLAGESDPNKRQQLHIAFRVLKERKDELQRLRTSIDETQDSEANGASVRHIQDAEVGKREMALENIYSAADKMGVIPPSTRAVKAVVDASYLVAVQAASTQRLSALNGNSERYLAAIRVLKARMEVLVKAQRAVAVKAGRAR